MQGSTESYLCANKQSIYTSLGKAWRWFNVFILSCFLFELFARTPCIAFKWPRMKILHKKNNNIINKKTRTRLYACWGAHVWLCCVEASCQRQMSFLGCHHLVLWDRDFHWSVWLVGQWAPGILLLMPPQCWDYKDVPQHPAFPHCFWWLHALAVDCVPNWTVSSACLGTFNEHPVCKMRP